jgi:hypothetical protein
MILKFNNLIPIALEVKIKNKAIKHLDVNVGKIIDLEIKNGQMNVIAMINKRSINKIKKLLSQPDIISAEIINK